MPCWRRRLLAAATVVALAGLAAACGGSPGRQPRHPDGPGGAPHRLAPSAATAGGMPHLVAAAKQEGILDVIGLPAGQANYGAILRAFSQTYGIAVESEQPDATSAQVLDTVRATKGRPGAPDVLDLVAPAAAAADAAGLLAPYRVATYDQIPAADRAPDASWYGEYDRYLAIGYDGRRVDPPPRSFADLLRPRYPHQVALPGDPARDPAAFAAVLAAASAEGGSPARVQPGLAYFTKLRREGNLASLAGSPGTAASGATPILLTWEDVQVTQIAAVVPAWRVVVPTDARYAERHDQAISAFAPHPAAARLWEEYLYSVIGQNLLLQGFVQPVELAALVAEGRVDRAAYQALPAARGPAIPPPTPAQLAADQRLVARQWGGGG